MAHWLALTRYSLGSADHKEAIDTLTVLDRTMAIKAGKAAVSSPATSISISLEEGAELYKSYVRRPAVAGGARPGTLKRYQAIFDKFLKFCAKKSIASWDNVTKDVLLAYGVFLENEDYAFATQHIELATLNQLLKYLALDAKRIPANCYAPLKLRKPDSVTRHCYTRDQVYTGRLTMVGRRPDHESHHIARHESTGIQERSRNRSDDQGRLFTFAADPPRFGPDPHRHPPEQRWQSFSRPQGRPPET